MEEENGRWKKQQKSQNDAGEQEFLIKNQNAKWERILRFDQQRMQRNVNAL